MTKEEIVLKETMGIFDEKELGITGLANAMDVYSKQECIAFAKWIPLNAIIERYGYQYLHLETLQPITEEQLYNLYIEQSDKK